MTEVMGYNTPAVFSEGGKRRKAKKAGVKKTGVKKAGAKKVVRKVVRKVRHGGDDMSSMPVASEKMPSYALDAPQAGGRKLSEYNKFMKKTLKSLKAKHPSKKATELMKMGAKLWRETKKGTKKVTKK